MSNLENISHEIMVFMRGKYKLDEIGDGKDELKFKQGQKTILTIYTHEDKFTFLIIFGRKEREIFEAQIDSFSDYIRNYYNNSKTYHDGKWMFIDVTTMEQLDEVKKLIEIKKKPNRKPFPKENAVYSKCGQRCDLCVHYVGTTDEQRAIMIQILSKCGIPMIGVCGAMGVTVKIVTAKTTLAMLKNALLKNAYRNVKSAASFRV